MALSSKRDACHTEGGSMNRSRSRVLSSTLSPVPPLRAAHLPSRLFDISPTEGSASHPRPHLIDSADTHTRDCELAARHSVRPDYREARHVVPVPTTYDARPNALVAVERQQSAINAAMRRDLINWLISIDQCIDFGRSNGPEGAEALCLAINYIDRFLSIAAHIDPSELQLVGASALLLAAKFEEIHAPALDDLVYLSHGAYAAEQLVRMERRMLCALGFELCTATPHTFLSRFAKVAGVLTAPRHKAEVFASYLVELSLVCYEMLKYSSPTLAAAVLYFALVRCVMDIKFVSDSASGISRELGVKYQHALAVGTSS
ncbi:hypothetical protein AB1Y20_017448 [Prymnesium parvum]|uniref:Cyclin-like domain-containing protein n=1 Tax=Prymnesium parvum TaxID=97485 RepID=A0AB34JN69_PRYPA